MGGRKTSNKLYFAVLICSSRNWNTSLQFSSSVTSTSFFSNLSLNAGSSRNFESNVRVQDRNEIDSDLKKIFLSRTREEALNQFTEFRNKWSPRYPRPVYNMGKNLRVLLKYYDYPESIRRSIHSTNLKERMNKEIRRRIKIIDSMPSEESAMKIIYLRSIEINERWSLRTLRGFYKCKDEIMEMFQKRYPL